MLRNYFKIAIRYLTKNRVFSSINLLGLTLGFTCFILLSLYVADELSFDKFHSDSQDIYRVIQKIKDPDGSTRQVATIAPLVGTEAKAQFPEVEDQTRLIQIGRVTVGNEPLNRNYERIWIADPNFFRFFDFKFLYGDPETALTKPDNIVITESVARKYFGKTDVVGKRLYTNVYEATVAGVIKDFPENSHIKMNIIHTQSTWAREIKSWKQWITSNWTDNSFITYVKMRHGFDKAAFEKKLTSLVTEHYGSKVDYKSTFWLQPLRDIHLYSRDIEGGLNAHEGNPLYVYMFSIVGILILIIACFNYMNLSAAAGSRRMQEIAMRKTMGAGKVQLILQFMGEALLLSLLSLVLAVIIIEITLPYINVFIGKNLHLPLSNIPLLTFLLVVVLASGVISALYPAFFLSRINPATALKKEIRIGSGSFSMRKVLIVVQFAISIVMIASTIIIYNQLNYLKKKDLGLTYHNRITVDINSHTLRSRFEAIKQAFNALPEVKSVTVSTRVPGEWKVLPIANVEPTDTDASTQVIFLGADKDFQKTYNIHLIKGRNLRDDVADSNSVLITKSAAIQLGLKDPIGHHLSIPSTIWNGDLDKTVAKYHPVIVGVVEDFYTQSLYHERRPVMIASYRNPIQNIDYYTLDISTNNWQKTIGKLKAINYKFDQSNPLEVTFLDTRFAQLYASDRTREELFFLFSGIIIFIACMGLFALASFSIEKRTKEIGVRKVLGASVPQITWLLSSDFAKLVGISFIISIPVAYWAIQSWLREFAYRISIQWWVFAAAGFIALVIALATISWQSIRAALTNPVESLRNE